MSEATTETPAPEGQEPEQVEEKPPWGDDFDAEKAWKLVQNLRGDVDKAKAKASEGAQAVKAAEQARLAAMTEAERTVAEAEARGRTAASTEFGKRLARTEFDALAGRRNPDVDTSAVLEFVDLSRFVGEDGEPDTKAIQQAVERLVPAPQAGTPSFDGGTRTTAPAPQGMNGFIRKATGRA